MRTLLLLLLLLTGCQSYEYDYGCDVKTEVAVGRGAIIGPTTVYTVFHVIDRADKIYVEGHPATIDYFDRNWDFDSGDGLVILKVHGYEFSPDRFAPIAPKYSPGYKYLPKRGEDLWPWGIRPGDSGSPILDSSGRLVGLVRAVQGRSVFTDKESLGKR